MRLLQSLTRGLDTLDYLRASAVPARLTDVAAALGVDKSNAAHLLKTLLAAGYAVQNEQRRYLAAGFGAAGKQRERTLEEVVAVKEGWRSALANARIWPCLWASASGTSTRSLPCCR